MMHARNLFFSGTIFNLSKSNQQQEQKYFVTMADDNNSGENRFSNRRQSVDLCPVHPFRVPPNFIDKNTTIDANFARKNYHFHQFFDPTKIQQLWHNLQYCHQQSTNGSNDDINHVIMIYQDVVNTIKQNCKIHLHNMICKGVRISTGCLKEDRSQGP